MPASPTARRPSLIPTKLRGPSLRPRLVDRPRLVQTVEQGLWRALTLVQAPAGSGKSTLIAQWAAETPSTVCWLCLEPADDRPARFLAYLLAALAPVLPPSDLAPEDLLQAPDHDEIASWLGELIVAPLDAREAPIVLVLEDAHVLDNEVIWQGISWLVEHQPRCLHLLICTREAPPLPLRRLQVRDLVTAIGRRDLQLAAPEAELFYGQTMGLDLSADQVAALEAKTEGWAAAAQLAALSLRSGADPDVFIAGASGADRPFAAYLVSEVLDRHPPEIRQFLLQSSVLDELVPGLCEAVTGDPLAAERLSALLEGQFLVSESKGPTLRFHPLFRDLLRDRLQTESAEFVRSLHLRAARWYLGAGELPQAGVHALASGDFAMLQRVIVQSGNPSSGMPLGELLGWLEALPDDLEIWSEVRIIHAWALAMSGQRRLAALAIAKLHPLPKSADMSAAEAAARAVLSLTSLDAQGALLPLERALSRDDLDAGERALLHLLCAQARRALADGMAAEADLRLSRLWAQRDGNTYLEQMATAGLLQGMGLQGRVTEGLALAAQALRRAPVGCGKATIQAFEADLLATSGRLDDALQAARSACRPLRLAQDRIHLASAILVPLRVSMCRGDLAGARRALAEAHAEYDHTDLPQAVAILVAMDAWVALRGLNLVPARELEAQLPELPRRYPADLVCAEFALAEGRPEDARASLLAGHSTAQQLGWLPALTEYELLIAVIELATGETEQARARWHGCIERAESAHIRMPALLFADLLAPFETSAPRRALEMPAAQIEPPVEPLTERELQVLSLAGTGLSNKAISQRLFISLATVKTHLHSVYGKLSTRNRTQATHRARALGLLS